MVGQLDIALGRPTDHSILSDQSLLPVIPVSKVRYRYLVRKLVLEIFTIFTGEENRADTIGERAILKK